MGLSFWLVPGSEDERHALERAMASVRQTVQPHGVDCSVPFEPHVTLLAGLTSEQGWTEASAWSAFEQKVLSRGAWLSGHGREQGLPLACRLKDIVSRGLYFQCILVAIEQSDALMRLNAEMRSAFSALEQPAYFPHCSLLYAHLSLQEAQSYIENMLTEGEAFVRSADGLTLAHDKADVIHLDTVELWDTNGSVQDWKRLRRVRLDEWNSQ